MGLAGELAHLWILRPLLVGLGVPQRLDVHSIGELHLVLCTPPDEDGLAPPFNGDGVPRLNLGQVDLQGSHGQHVLGSLQQQQSELNRVPETQLTTE